MRNQLQLPFGGRKRRVTAMDLDIINGQIFLNGKPAPNSKGYEVKQKGAKKAADGQWVCEKCGAADKMKKLLFKEDFRDQECWTHIFRCKCGNTIEIFKVALTKI